MKRYAIVRVDKDWCPYYSDKEFIIPCSNFCENRFECSEEYAKFIVEFLGVEK